MPCHLFTTVEDRIVSLLSQFPDLTYGDLAESLSVSRATVIRNMKKMIDNGLVERVRSKKTGKRKLLK